MVKGLKKKFEIFYNIHTNTALARLEQSRIMLAIRLKEHHGKNHEVIDEASDFIQNVYQDVWPSLSVNKPEKCAADNPENTGKGSRK